MAVFRISRTLAFGETLIIPETDTWLWNRHWTPVLQTEGRARIEILGHVTGQNYGIDTAGPRNTILIGPGGTVSAPFTVIQLDGRGDRLINHGTILDGKIEVNGHDVVIRNTGMIGGNDYPAINLDARRGASLFNDGWIEAGNTGILIESVRDPQAELHSIVNTGMIFGRTFGLYATPGGRAQITFDNQGTLAGGNFSISGDIVAYRGTDRGVDRVTNSGLILGNVELGGSDDRYEALGRGRIEGRVYGGDGEDTLLGNGGNEWLSGDNGDDFIRGGGGRDMLNGGMGHDRLWGGAGNDILYGLEGNDTLHGGAGNDTMTGGTGRDVFVFEPRSETDTVTDFELLNDRIDLTAFAIRPEDFATVLLPAIQHRPGVGTVIDLSLLGGTGELVIVGLPVAAFDPGLVLL